jgi:hypothetical protein
MSIAKIGQWLLALAAGGVFRLWGAGILLGVLLTLSGFLFGRFAITDARTARHGTSSRRTRILSNDAVSRLSDEMI